MIKPPSQPHSVPLPTTEIDPLAAPSTTGIQVQAGLSKAGEALPQAPNNPMVSGAPEGPSILDAMGSAALISNATFSLGSWLSQKHEEDTSVDPNFDSYTYLQDRVNDERIKKLSPLLIDRVADALPRLHNETQFWQYVGALGDENARNEKAGSAGILPLLAGGLLGAVTDPISWVGVGIGAKVGAAMRLGGLARGAIAGAVEGAVPGVVHLATRETYGVTDLFTDIGAGTALGGVLGKFLMNDMPGSSTRKAFSLESDPNIVLPPGVEVGDVLGGTRSGGAAASPLGDEAGTRGRMMGFDALTPVGRAIARSSKNPADFALHQRLYEMSVATKGNEAGAATAESAEMLSELFHMRSLIRDVDVKRLYDGMAKEVFAEGAVVRAAKNALNRKEGRLTTEQFYEAITDYRRAQSVLDYEGEGASQAARNAAETPHPNPKVADYIRRAGEVEQRFYTEWADQLESAGMLSKDERRAIYVPSIMDRRAVVLGREELGQILRDHLATRPPAGWLEARWGVTDLKALDATDRELALGDWVISQKDDIDKAARQSLKEATARLAEVAQGASAGERLQAKTARTAARDLVARSRVITEQTQQEFSALRLARQQAEAEQFAMQKALDEAAMRNLGREGTAPRTGPDAGERALAASGRADRAVARSEKDVNKFFDDVVDTMAQGSPAQREWASAQLAQLEDAVAGKVRQLDVADAAAFRDPAGAAQARERNTAALPERIARDNLNAANKRLAAIDKDLSKVEVRLADLHAARGELDGRLAALKDSRAATAKYLRGAEKARKVAQRDANKATKTIEAVDQGRIKTTEERVDEILERMVAGRDVPRGTLEEAIGTSGRVKSRDLFEGNILMDPRLQKFLVRDAGHIADRYSRDLSPRAALMQKFGTENPVDLQREIRTSWSERIKDPERAEALSKESIEDFNGTWMRVMGRLGNDMDPASKLAFLSRNVRRFNVVRLMGLPLLSSFTDIATGVLATKSAFGWMPKFFKQAQATLDKIPDRELRALLIGLEQSRFMGANTRRLMPEDSNLSNTGGFGTGKTYAITSAIDRTLDSSSRAMQSLNGLGAWTAHLKFVFGTVQLENMQRDFARFGTLSAKMQTRYARLGIDSTWAERIQKQLTAHGEDIDGVRVPAAQNWTDKAARMRWLTALHRVQNEGAISPGMGDTPLLMSKEMGKLVLQFMSYAFASTNKWTRLAYQQADVNALASFHMMMATGLLGYVAREYVKGVNLKGESPGDRLAKKNTADWVYEALTRSAIPGAYSIGMDVTRKLMLGPVQDAIGLKLFATPPSRMQERSAWSTALGPTAGLLDNTSELAQALVRQDGKVLDKAARLLPFQNLLPIVALHSAVAGGRD